VPAASSDPAVAAPSRPSGEGLPGGPLAGITVLDLSSVGPASRCTRVLADYGATVVKVGPVPGAGAQPIRPPFYAYSGSRHLQRTAIDLKDPDGRASLLALVASADVVVESFRPGVMDRLGLGFADLSAVNPGIILCSTTGYGQEGPHAGWAGHDLNYLAVGGYLATSGRRADGGPPLPGATVADAAAGGLQAALAIVAALLARGTDGPGTHLDVSVADGVLWLTSLAVDEHLATGVPVGPGHDVLTGRYACYDTYRASDGGFLAVGAIESRFFANLCRLLGCPQWIDRQYDDDVQEAIRKDLAAAFATRGRDQWVAELAGADTCVTAVLSAAEVGDDPQYAARRAIVDAVAESPAGEPPVRFRQVGPVLAGMARPPGPVVARDPDRSDTDRLLRAAGLPEARVADLRERGVVA
jgi:alpha-methylacyl-CoA racemase